MAARKLKLTLLAGFLAVSSTVAVESSAQAPPRELPREQWLKNLRPILSGGLCRGAGSPFMQVYKGDAESCVSTVNELFDKCATKEPRVVIPERITSLEQANLYGQVMAECVSAHYQGGAALDAFYKLQDSTNAAPPADGSSDRSASASTGAAAIERFKCVGTESLFPKDDSNPTHVQSEFLLELNGAAKTLSVQNSLASDGTGELLDGQNGFTAWVPTDFVRKGLHFTYRMVNVDRRTGRATISSRRGMQLQAGDLHNFEGQCTREPGTG